MITFKIDTPGFFMLTGAGDGICAAGLGLIVFNKIINQSVFEWGVCFVVVGLLFLTLGYYALKHPDIKRSDE